MAWTLLFNSLFSSCSRACSCSRSRICFPVVFCRSFTMSATWLVNCSAWARAASIWVVRRSRCLLSCCCSAWIFSSKAANSPSSSSSSFRSSGPSSGSATAISSNSASSSSISARMLANSFAAGDPSPFSRKASISAVACLVSASAASIRCFRPSSSCPCPRASGAYEAFSFSSSISSQMFAASALSASSSSWYWRMRWAR
mmetsp:Transcript_72578/g.193570  ORF Transcript_72578/g.193570 Transcript_72578/m.193570 type:complete len:201 (-) Transcript_72578:171-773(-)